MLTFLGSLKDTDRKNAMWLLISQILHVLDKEEIVKKTRSTSHVTGYSTLYEVVSFLDGCNSLIF